MKISLWDTAGQERFKCIIPTYVRDSDVAVICYDITNEKSLDNAAYWLKSARDLRGDNISVAVVGNKKDMEADRKVTPS